MILHTGREYRSCASGDTIPEMEGGGEADDTVWEYSPLMTSAVKSEGGRSGEHVVEHVSRNTVRV